VSDVDKYIEAVDEATKLRLHSRMLRKQLCVRPEKLSKMDQQVADEIKRLRSTSDSNVDEICREMDLFWLLRSDFANKIEPLENELFEFENKLKYSEYNLLDNSIGLRSRFEALFHMKQKIPAEQKECAWHLEGIEIFHQYGKGHLCGKECTLTEFDIPPDPSILSLDELAYLSEFPILETEPELTGEHHFCSSPGGAVRVPITKKLALWYKRLSVIFDSKGLFSFLLLSAFPRLSLAQDPSFRVKVATSASGTVASVAGLLLVQTPRSVSSSIAEEFL
jgi:hypothetical protein